MPSERVPLIPLSCLFASNAYSAPKISPDGRMVSFLARHRGCLNIWCGPWRSNEYRPVTSYSERDISHYRWAPDSARLLYLRDEDGDENTHLHMVDAAGGHATDLTPFDKVRTRIIAVETDIPGEILVGLNRRDKRYFDVFRLDLAAGGLSEVFRNPGYSKVVADRALRVRCAVAQTGRGLDILVRDDAESPWRALHRVGGEDVKHTRPVAFTEDDRDLLVLSSAGTDSTRLLQFSVADGTCKTVFEDPAHDVGTVGLHPRTRKPDHVIVQRERNEMEVLDPALRPDTDRLRAESARGSVSLFSRSHDDRIWLVRTGSDNAPPCYAVYDRDARALAPLFSQAPDLAAYPLSSVRPFSFHARDGLLIRGYLTLPADLEPLHLPTVLAVHGGPWTRDDWDFHRLPQWLANRGYLCVAVNYRGSTGYGKRFTNAGDHEWGGRMQDDLTDAVRHVVDRGLADPARVAIFGNSYGGYAALAGAAFTPGLYRCAVAAAAPTNLITFIESVPAYWRYLRAELSQRIGDPESERDFLWSRSPLSRVEDIRVPLLIAQGANDPRVPLRESQQIVDALKRHDIPHEYLLFPDEGHGFSRPRNRMAFYAAAEKFLARHLGGRTEQEKAGS